MFISERTVRDEQRFITEMCDHEMSKFYTCACVNKHKNPPIKMWDQEYSYQGNFQIIKDSCNWWSVFSTLVSTLVDHERSNNRKFKLKYKFTNNHDGNKDQNNLITSNYPSFVIALWLIFTYNTLCSTLKYSYFVTLSFNVATN